MRRIALLVALAGCDGPEPDGPEYVAPERPEALVGDGDCQEVIELSAESAEVIEPMVLGMRYDIDGAGARVVAYFAASAEPGEGMIVFEFETLCTGSWELEGLTKDPSEGRLEDGDPDTWGVQVDDEPEWTWELGCVELGEPWGWRPAWTYSEGCVEVTGPVRAAGHHVVALRAGEAKDGLEWTALERLRLTVGGVI